jgi:hypothetical protein
MEELALMPFLGNSFNIQQSLVYAAEDIVL